MRYRRAAGMVAAATAVLVGSAVAPAHAVSPYDPGTQSSLRSLVTAMESYAMFDGDDAYTGVTAAALRDWGWARTSSVDVAITIEGDGASWRAVGQDIHSGASEYTYSSTFPVNGVSAGSVQKSAPQPAVRPAVATVTITDVGDAIDVDGLAYALVAGGVTLGQVCDFTVFVPGSHLAGTTTSDQTDACEAAAAASGASMRSVLARVLATGGSGVLAAIALEFVGDGTQTASPPTWTTQPSPTPPSPRTPPASVPEGIWHITKKARQLATANQVDEATARVATEQCLKLVTIAFTGADPYGKCSTEPIFLSGQSDVPEATNHDLEALAQTPTWIQLNRKLGGNGSPTWKDSDPTCVNKAAGQNCDEYPFLSTTQGGGQATPRPSLKAIDGPQNQLQGTRLGQFYDVCGVADGDEFLAIPVPPTASTVPTLAMCNPS